MEVQQAQVQDQFKNLPIQIQKQEFIFKITKEAVLRSGFSVQEIINIVNSQNISSYKKIQANDKQTLLLKKRKYQTLCICLHKLKNNVHSFSNHQNFSQFIAKELSHVQFTHTIYLNLSACNLYSLEDLEFLNIPVLQTLQLFNNKIGNIKPFSKNCTMKNLATLSIYTNPIRQMIHLSRGLFPKLYYFEINISRDALQPSSIETLLFAAKLEAKFLSQSSIKLWATQTIKQQKAYKIANIKIV